MLPDYVYFVALAVLLLVTVPLLLRRAGRRRLLQALPAFAFFALLLLVAEVAFRVGGHQAGGVEGTATTIYSCSMHPQVRATKPGLCPICHMALEPLDKIGKGSANEVTID